MKKKRVWLIVAALVLTIAAITVYNRKKAADSAATQAAVQEFTVTRGNITRTVEATGFIQPLEEVEIYSDVDGEVIRLDVVSGQKVKKGQVLALVDAKVELNQPERVRADYLESKTIPGAPAGLPRRNWPSWTPISNKLKLTWRAPRPTMNAWSAWRRKDCLQATISRARPNTFRQSKAWKIAKAKKELELENAQDWEITAAKARLESAKVNLEILEERP